jgi:transcription antitermination factor NusA-like protein
MLLDDCRSKTTQLVVPESTLPAIIGKKGTRVQALRQQFPDATVDVDRDASIVRVYAESEELREQVSQEILQIVDENLTVELTIERDAAIGLKGQR